MICENFVQCKQFCWEFDGFSPNFGAEEKLATLIYSPLKNHEFLTKSKAPSPKVLKI